MLLDWFNLFCTVTIASTKVLVDLLLSAATSVAVPLHADFLGKFEGIHNEGCMLLGSLHAPPSAPLSLMECCELSPYNVTALPIRLAPLRLVVGVRPLNKNHMDS